MYSTESFVGAQHANIRRAHSNWAKNDSNKGLAVVWHHAAEYVSRLNLCKDYSLYGGMWNLFHRAGHYPCVQNLLWSIRRRNPHCNAKDNLHVGLVVIESWFGGYWGSPGLGGVRIAELSPLVGLPDYEDTRLKTSSRVRMGLSLAWKSSLAIRICRSPTIVTDSV